MIVLTAAQMASAILGALLAAAGLAAVLWRLMAAITRHIDATKANTAAVANLGDQMAVHMTRTDARINAVSARVRHLERLNNVPA